MAAGAGLDGSGGRSGVGSGCSHHRPMGHDVCRGRSQGSVISPIGRFPPALTGEQQAELKTAVQEAPRQSGIELSNWNWKAVRRFVEDRFGLALSRSPP